MARAGNSAQSLCAPAPDRIVAALKCISTCSCARAALCSSHPHSSCVPRCSFVNEVAVGDGTHGTTVAKDIGSKAVSGKTAEAWQWEDTLFKKIAMDTKTLFVDQQSGLPVRLDEEITPLGKPLGSASTLYTNFTATPVDDSLFAVSNVDMCPMSNSCNHSPTRSRMWDAFW